MPVDTAMTKPAKSRLLGALLPEQAEVFGELPVTGIAYDSRQVQPGDLFFALPGTQVDGAQFAADAVAAGAVAVVAARPLGVDAPSIRVVDPRRTMAEVSHRFHGHPDRAIKVIGITGTNGKSTVAAGLEQVWQSAGRKAGSLGTLMYRWGDTEIPAARTTPEAPDLIGYLARMRDDGVKFAALEVSSHSVALDRVWSLQFGGGVFTNITRDHLDFHKSFGSYKEAKKQFFERLNTPEGFAAINIDDPAATEFIDACHAVRVIRYSATDSEADVYLEIDSHDFDGTRGRLVISGTRWPFQSPLWGEFNHANMAAIAAAACGTGLDGAAIAVGLSAFSGIAGRVEKVAHDAPFQVLVDFAHTPDALHAVLSAARPLTAGRLLVVFGCGGDRDRGKRPEMARAVAAWADQIYLTSDNPRSEDPEQIIADTKKGFGPDTHVWSDSDRVRAITQAVNDAKPGDVLFLCGKGHEETQEIAGVKHRFSDRDVVAQALAAVGQPPHVP